jgi:2-oxoglutarate dehydrogenase E2 component (dihydrolipoamide succinyltransferase)
MCSPAVRRIVDEEKIDPKKWAGPKGGRLTKAMLLAMEIAIKRLPSPRQNRRGRFDDSSWICNRSNPLLENVATRRKIAAQLVMAQHTAAILTTFNECDMTEVQALRAKSQEAFTKKHGIKLGFMSFFIKATVEALQAVPSINGRIEGDDFIQNNYYDIGVAGGTERGLVVPVVRDADKKSFADLERDISDYATRAREGKIKIEDLQGGTFTISNGGVYGR